MLFTKIKIEFIMQYKKYFLFIIFLVALILRIAVILFLGQEQIMYDSHIIAINLVNGNGFSMEFFPSTGLQETCAKQPLYPFFIAFFYLIFGINSNALLVIQIVQVFISSSTIFPIYLLAKKNFSEKIALISCSLFAIYPDFLYSVYSIHSLCITIFFFPSIILTIQNFKEKPNITRGIFLGAFLGFAALHEPVLITIPIFIFTFYLLKFIFTLFKKKCFLNFKNLLAKRNIPYFLILLIFSFIITPWLIRCYFVYDRFVFIKANGFNIWRGNNPEYTETGIPSSRDYDFGNLTDEGAIDELFLNMGFNYIFTNLIQTIINFFKKQIEFWWFPQSLTEQSPLLRILIYTPILILFIISFIFIIKRKQINKLIPLIISMFGFSCIYSLSFILPRYRVPIQTIMLIFSSYCIVKLIMIIQKYFKIAIEEK